MNFFGGCGGCVGFVGDTLTGTMLWRPKLQKFGLKKLKPLARLGRGAVRAKGRLVNNAATVGHYQFCSKNQALQDKQCAVPVTRRTHKTLIKATSALTDFMWFMLALERKAIPASTTIQQPTQSPHSLPFPMILGLCRCPSPFTILFTDLLVPTCPEY